VGDAGSDLALLTVLDPIAEAKTLSGRKHLTPAEARQRYAAILAALAVGGRKQSWIAEQIGCTDSNMSRLVRAARQALGQEIAA
jgi:DNA-binding MarR family transcriptional regulator